VLFINCSLIDKQAGVFPGKICLYRCKNHLYMGMHWLTATFGVGTAAKCYKLIPTSNVPTEFVAEPNSTTTEYCFELSLSIYRYYTFFLKFKTLTLSNNHFAKSLSFKKKPL